MKFDIWTKTKSGWVKAEHKEWGEVISDGWRFVCMIDSETILMERNGYLNEWQFKKVVEEPMAKQKKYCEEHKLPFFAPSDGICWSCHKKIPDDDSKHVTGCPFCSWSYCD